VNRPFVNKIAVFCALVALPVAVRLMTETPNFGAVTAAALFAGFYFRHAAVAACVPLAVLMISDQFLGGYARSVMFAVYGAALLPVAWRSFLRADLNPLRVGTGAIGASLIFYLVTNAAVWAAWYPMTWEGAARCYTSALPFFLNSLTSDLLFAASFFGLYALVTRRETANAAAPAVASV